MPLIIKKAMHNDTTAIRALFYETVTTVNAVDYDTEQIRIWAAKEEDSTFWDNKIADQDFYVARKNSKIVGFSSLDANGCIDFMFVHKDHQRQGIAAALLAKMEQLAKRAEMDKIWADVSITARPFFQKHGFIITKSYTKQLQGVAFNNVIMTKVLRV